MVALGSDVRNRGVVDPEQHRVESPPTSAEELGRHCIIHHVYGPDFNVSIFEQSTTPLPVSLGHRHNGDLRCAKDQNACLLDVVYDCPMH